MKKLRELWRRLLFYFRRDRFDREMKAEMRFHLDMKIRTKIQGGMPARQAENAAQRQFGNVTLLQERSRDMWAFRWIDDLFQDLRYSLRMIRKSPVLAFVIVLSLGLAIGANTAIFSLVDAVMLKTLPVKAPAELVLFGWASAPNPPIDSHNGSMKRDPVSGQLTGTSLSYAAFEQMRAENQTLSDLFAFVPIRAKLNVSTDSQVGTASGQFATGAYYRGLGVPAIIGRIFTEAEDRVGAEPVAVISYNYWKERFNSDPAIVGKPAYINAVPFTIIGVTPPEFEGTLEVGETADVTLPLATEPLVNRHPAQADQPWRWWLRVMGRLKPGVSLEQARANLEPTFQRAALAGHLAYLAVNPPPESSQAATPLLVAISGSQGMTFQRGYYIRQLYILLIVVGLVLLIACVNTANLLLARSSARQKEIAVRIAMGAGRRRLIRQLLTESLTLALLGGAAGFILASWVKSFRIIISPYGGDPLKVNLNLDLRVLGFTAGLSILTGVLFGIAPAFRATRIDPFAALKDNSSNQSQGSRRLALGKILIMAQVALSLLLLVGAGLFVRTLRNLQHVDYGFDANNVLLFDVNPSLNGYKAGNLANIYRQITERVGAIPGVQSATASMYPLMKGYGWIEGGLEVPGAKDQPDDNEPIYLFAVNENFLATMRIPIILGHNLDGSAGPNSPKIAVVNQTFVRLAFKDQNPIGRQFRFKENNKMGFIEIVGVSRDAKYDDLRNPTPALAYLPYQQYIPQLDQWASGMTFEARTSGDPAALTLAVREALRSIDRNLAIDNVKTQMQQINDQLVNERIFASLTGALGVMALILAGLGLYGVMSYNVSRRTGEIGIRMALGASGRQVLRQILKETMLLVGIGVGLGIVASLAAMRLVSSSLLGAATGQTNLLFGVKPNDPATIALAALFLLTTAVLAGYLPARRASRIDPLAALRCD